MVVRRRRAKPLLIIIIILSILVVFATGIVCSYLYFVGPVDNSSKANIEVIIPSGTSTNTIATILKKKRLIKNEFFFKMYIKLNNINSLKASTYVMRQSMSLKEIIAVLEKGSSPNVRITFKEGVRLSEYAREISENTNYNYEEVISTFKNEEYINKLVDKYWFLTEDILDDDIYYPLEGYLAPDTYHFESVNVELEKIIETMLDETGKKWERYRNVLQNNIHEYITMASLVELEGTNTDNRKVLVGIFNNRLDRNMNLGSDVTTYYALQYPMDKDLTTSQFSTDNPYNTRSASMKGKMPIGPICNPSVSSVEASIYPTKSSYLYFVADKHGNIYYTRTLAEHNAKVLEIKEKGDWIW